MSTRKTPGGERRPVRKGDDLSTFTVPKVEKIRSLSLPDPQGPAQACNGKTLPLPLALYGVETSTCTLRKVEEKYLERSEMWCWREMEKISWKDRVRNEEVLHRVKKERNIIHTIRRRKASWTENVLRGNRLLKHIIEER
jgi:hypothetical protein